MKLNNCLLKEIREIEMVQGTCVLVSTCRTSSNNNDSIKCCLNVSSPTLSTTYLDSKDSSKQDLDCSCPATRSYTFSEDTCELACYQKINLFSQKKEHGMATAMQLSPPSDVTSNEDLESTTSSSLSEDDVNEVDEVDASTDAV